MISANRLQSIARPLLVWPLQKAHATQAAANTTFQDQPAVYHKVEGDSVPKRSSGVWGARGTFVHCTLSTVLTLCRCWHITQDAQWAELFRRTEEAARHSRPKQMNAHISYAYTRFDSAALQAHCGSSVGSDFSMGGRLLCGNTQTPGLSYSMALWTSFIQACLFLLRVWSFK